MKLTRDQVLHIATLARLGLTEEEILKLQGELSNILQYVEQLGEVDTEGILPTAQVTDLANVSRADEVLDSMGPDALADPKALLACSPLPIERNQIKVKNVF